MTISGGSGSWGRVSDSDRECFDPTVGDLWGDLGLSVLGICLGQEDTGSCDVRFASSVHPGHDDIDPAIAFPADLLLVIEALICSASSMVAHLMTRPT